MVFSFHLFTFKFALTFILYYRSLLFLLFMSYALEQEEEG